MRLYCLLPATDYGWTKSIDMDSVMQMRDAKQGVFNRSVVVRAKLIGHVVFSAIELALHIAAGVTTFSTAVIQLPLYPIFGGVSPRAAFIDATAHVGRSARLLTAILFVPLLGLAEPEWSVDLYRRLSLVQAPSGCFARLIHRARCVSNAAWRSPYRNRVIGAVAVFGFGLLVSEYVKSLIVIETRKIF